MLLELIIIKILSSTRIEDIKNVFRLYLDLFIKNNENEIKEQPYNKLPNKFSKGYRMKNIKIMQKIYQLFSFQRIIHQYMLSTIDSLNYLPHDNLLFLPSINKYGRKANRFLYDGNI